MEPRFPHLKINCFICFFITESNQITTPTCYPNSLRMSKMFSNMEYFKEKVNFVNGEIFLNMGSENH